VYPGKKGAALLCVSPMCVCVCVQVKPQNCQWLPTRKKKKKAQGAPSIAFRSPEANRDGLDGKREKLWARCNITGRRRGSVVGGAETIPTKKKEARQVPLEFFTKRRRNNAGSQAGSHLTSPGMRLHNNGQCAPFPSSSSSPKEECLGYNTTRTRVLRPSFSRHLLLLLYSSQPAPPAQNLNPSYFFLLLLLLAALLHTMK
jgi:hypothetical protein